MSIVLMQSREKKKKKKNKKTFFAVWQCHRKRILMVLPCNRKAEKERTNVEKIHLLDRRSSIR